MLEEIKKELRPRKKIYEIAESFKKQLKSKEINFELGGSVAKKTNLKGAADIDIFARFHKDGNLSKKLGKLLEEFNPEKIHGSRDYYQITHEGICIEIVPVLKINNPKKAKNVTDMSPLHVQWANKHLNNKLRDEIRLAKQFCKAQKIYGAESHIRGLSGHVIDILIIYYGGFIELLQQATVWGDKVVIDIEIHNTANKLNRSKTQSPLIVIDPIQTERNAAAGLSNESFITFKKAARKFLEKPRKEMFVIKTLDEKTFRKKHKNVVVINYSVNKGKPDVVGSKIRQVIDFVRKRTEEFYPTEYEWDFERAFLAYKEKKLGKKMLVKGPPKSKKLDAEKFRKKHKKIIEKEGILYAEETREHLRPEEKVLFLIKDKYVEERVKEIK